MLKFSDFKPLRNMKDKAAIELYLDNPCQFIEEQFLCIDAMSGINNSLIKLFPYQKEIFENVLKRDSDGNYVYNTAYISMGKKNDKTGMATKIATYLFFTEKIDSEYVLIGNNKDQASAIAYRNFVKACTRNPRLRELVDITKTGIQRKNSFIKIFPLPHTDAANHGFSDLAFVGFDEGWGYKDSNIFLAFAKNPARKNFLTLHTTYAGPDSRVPLYKVYERGKEGTDPKMFFYCKEASFTSEEHWKEANPAPWVTMEYLKDEQLQYHDFEFNRIHLNMWNAGTDITKNRRFVTQQQVINITNPNLSPVELGNSDYRYVCGVDLGRVHDLTALAVVHKENNKVKLDRLDVWKGTKTNPVKISDVEARMKEVYHRYRCSFAIDPWQMASTIERFTKDYTFINITEVDFRSSYTEMTELLYRLINNCEIEIYPNAGVCYDSLGKQTNFQTELLDLHVKILSDGNIKFDHDSSCVNDRTTAVAMAVMKLFNSKILLPRCRVL